MLWGEEVLKKHTRMTNYLKRVKYGPKQRIFWEEIENLKDKLEQTDIINDTIEYDYSEIGDDYFHKIPIEYFTPITSWYTLVQKLDDIKTKLSCLHHDYNMWSMHKYIY